MRKLGGGALGYVLPAVFCNLLWGSAIPVINLGYRAFGIGAGMTSSQLAFAGLRFLLAGLLTLAYTRLRTGKPVRLSAEGIRDACVLSLVQTILQYVFFYIGVARTASVEASIIQGLGAFVSILIASFVFRYEKMNAGKWLGGLIGILGIVILNLRAQDAQTDRQLVGPVCLVLSMVSSAASTGLIKRYGKRHDPVVLSGAQFVIGGLCMTLLGFSLGGRLETVSLRGCAILGYLAFLSAAAYAVWAWLLTRWQVSRIAVFMFLQPIFGVLLGLVLVRQRLTLPLWQYALATVCISASILLVNRAAQEGKHAGK